MSYLSENNESHVALSACDCYDTKLLESILREHFEELGITSEVFAGKRVAIKPNLIMKKPPEYAATTSPELLDALLKILDECACESVTIAESSGGPYTTQSLEASYKVCGLAEVVRTHNAVLNYDTSFRELDAPSGRIVKKLDIISPICDADIVISLPRLKTHSLTGMSGAVKNYFGVVPGLEKFELHARFPDYNDFSAMLVDLCTLIHERAYTINILDAVIGMEGNGPTGGKPRKIGCILTSRSAFKLDAIARELINAGDVLTVNEANRRGLAPSSASEVNVLGDDYKHFIVRDFKRPDSRKHGTIAMLQTFSGGIIGEYFRPRPIVGNDCVGCGECERSCPKKAITMCGKDGKRRPRIDLESCIRCFCCQELCPRHTIKVKKRGVVALINRAKKER